MKKLKELLDQLRNLDPNDPGRWPLGVRVGTVVLLFVIAAAAGYWYFVWKAKRPELLEARAKETELWNTLESKARKAANLQAYKDQLAEMEKSFGAMLRQLPNKTEVPNLLVDISQTALVKGDALCLSIAAASVLAKTARDRLMYELDANYRGYGLGKHKGYGTLAHRLAMQRLGVSPVHRRSFRTKEVRVT